uniref:importin subunit alpha-8-like n=1 Tax=Macaca mulatta TaxID=9544 RepID=UPI0010A26C27|nr:importin subunit alpha-8-like [Macaca mulatta]
MVEEGPIQPLIKLLYSPSVAVREQASGLLIVYPVTAQSSEITSSQAMPSHICGPDFTQPTNHISAEHHLDLVEPVPKEDPMPCETAVKQMLLALSLPQHHHGKVLSSLLGAVLPHQWATKSASAK